MPPAGMGGCGLLAVAVSASGTLPPWSGAAAGSLLAAGRAAASEPGMPEEAALNLCTSCVQTEPRWSTPAVAVLLLGAVVEAVASIAGG